MNITNKESIYYKIVNLMKKKIELGKWYSNILLGIAVWM